MTFRDLQKVIQSQSNPKQSQALQRLRNKEFWYWDQTEHKYKDKRTKGDCCFNHIVGLPRKDGKRKPLFDYELLLYRALLVPGYLNSIASLHSNDPNNIAHSFKVKHLWVKKATGLGVTEFMLRFMAWLCLKDDSYRNSQMVIITGPNWDQAIKLIKRMKALFESLGITFDSKETVLELNGCTIEAFPSNHIDAFRSLTNPKFILLDEADFFRKNEQGDVRHVAERYIAKSDPFIVMVSTPNAPGGLFEKIEKEPFDTCIYKKIFLDYTYGLGKIYTKEEVDKAKQSPSFEREYNLKYLGKIGNVFHTKDIDEALEKGQTNIVAANKMSPKSMGIDPGWGSSPFGIVITQWADNQIHVLYADEFERPDYNDMLYKISSLMTEFKLNTKNCKIYIDGANPSFIKSLKFQMGENPEYDKIIARYKLDRMDWTKSMTVIPVNFGLEHKEMLSHTKMIFEKESIFINPMFDKLITSLRTAVEREGIFVYSNILSLYEQ